MEIELWDEGKADTSESQEEMRRIAEAKLTAHTEQLGPLEESASQRLTLVPRGLWKNISKPRQRLELKV